METTVNCTDKYVQTDRQIDRHWVESTFRLTNKKKEPSDRQKERAFRQTKRKNHQTDKKKEPSDRQKERAIRQIKRKSFQTEKKNEPSDRQKERTIRQTKRKNHQTFKKYPYTKG